MLLTAEGAVLLLIDLQERLIPVIADHEAVVARSVRLAEAAQLLDVPIRATEQHPAGLGATVPPLAAYPQATLAKTTFSAAADPGFPALLPAGAEQAEHRLQDADMRLDPGDDDLAGSGRQQRGEPRIGRR